MFQDKKRQFSIQTKQHSIKRITDGKSDWTTTRNFLTIAPALPIVSGVRGQTPRLNQRSLSTVVTSNENGGNTSCLVSGEPEMAPHEVVFLQTTPEGKVQATRSQKEKEKNPDRICLDR